MPLDEVIPENRELNELVNNIRECVNKRRLDDMMYSFVHLYAQLSEDIINKTKLNMLYKDISIFLSNKDNMQVLELFYKIYESLDEGEMLLDPTVTDQPIYTIEFHKIKYKKIEREFYEHMIRLKLRITEQLGKVKHFLFKERGLDYDNW